MREKFKEILEDHEIYGEDVEEILYAVSDILDYVADDMKKKMPYATNSIDRLKKAAYEVYSLVNELD